MPLTCTSEKRTRWSDVADWLKELEPDDKQAAHFVFAANAAFELRYRTRQMNDDATAKELLGLVTY